MNNWIDVRGKKRKRNGQYKRKHQETIKHLALFCIVIWAVVVFVDAPKVFEGSNTQIIEIVRAASIGEESISSGTEEDNTDILVSAGVQADSESVKVEPRPTLSDESIEGKIREAWIGTGESDIAVAVAKGESGLHQYAMGWNCHYRARDGRGYSTSCKEEDREQAWSVDCGIFQINTLGKNCPHELFDIDHNIQEAKKKYDRRGFQPWVAWKNKQYLNHMK